MTHSLQARQRNDAELQKNEMTIERIEAKKLALETELIDLQNTRRALLAMAVCLRDAGGQL